MKDETGCAKYELARALGAKIVTVYGSDIGSQVAEYAMVSNVSKVVLGRTNHRFFMRKPMAEVLEKLNSMAPNIDVYIIPDMKNRKAAGKYGHREGRRKAENAGMQALWEFGLINIILVLLRSQPGFSRNFTFQNPISLWCIFWEYAAVVLHI